jgi:hypothetical protein
MRMSWLACLMCAGCGLHNAWSRSYLERDGRYMMTEEVMRPCGLPHRGLRTPTLSNTHRFLCWPANGGSTLRSLSDQITSGSEGLSPFESARNATLTTTTGIAPPLRFAFWVSSWLRSGFGLFLCRVFLRLFFVPSSSAATIAQPRHKGIPPCSGRLGPCCSPLAEGRDEGPCASIYRPSWGSLGSCNCTAVARLQ